LCWIDFFWGTTATVEMEKDLAVKQQLLDVVIVRHDDTTVPLRPPDGFEDLGKHNLVSFKSMTDTLDEETLEELIGHGVNYRKQVSPSLKNLLPRSDFVLFAVSARYPQGLAAQVTMEQVRDGVYAVRYFSRNIRVVVLNELPRQQHNAMLHMFAASEPLREYAAGHYRPRSPEINTLLCYFIRKYHQEGLPVPPTLEELHRQALEQLLSEVPPEELLKRLSARFPIHFQEGASGSVLQPGHAWIAPGDYHMIVVRDGTQVRLLVHQDPPENSCRPAVDVLFRSVANAYGSGVLAVVLTGMGQDGLRGCEAIRAAGGQILAQDEATSVVWGMPGYVARANLADRVLPLSVLGDEIRKRVR
jgi:hypothetical protein